MSRGDQRDRDRAKNQAKQAEKAKAQSKAGDPLKRNANDAAALQAKVAAKQEKQALNAASTVSTKEPVVRKKVNMKKDSVDDLLSAGLAAAKKRTK